MSAHDRSDEMRARLAELRRSANRRAIGLVSIDRLDALPSTSICIDCAERSHAERA